MNPPFGRSELKSLANIPSSSFTPKSDLIDLTLSNVKRFYSPKGDPLAVKELKQENEPKDTPLTGHQPESSAWEAGALSITLQRLT